MYTSGMAKGNKALCCGLSLAVDAQFNLPESIASSSSAISTFAPVGVVGRFSSSSKGIRSCPPVAIALFSFAADEFS